MEDHSQPRDHGEAITEGNVPSLRSGIGPTWTEVLEGAGARPLHRAAEDAALALYLERAASSPPRRPTAYRANPDWCFKAGNDADWSKPAAEFCALGTFIYLPNTTI